MNAIKQLTYTIFFVLIFSSYTLTADEHSHHSSNTHQHGIANLNIAIEKNSLFIEFISPAINLLGFEHKPSTEEEKEKLADTVTILEQALLFSPENSSCQFNDIKIKTNQDNDEKNHDHSHHHKKDKQHNDHYEFIATYQAKCDNMPINFIDVNIFYFFPTIEKIITQIISDTTQDQQILLPPSKKRVLIK